MYICSASSRGLLPVDNFCIGLGLAVFHQCALPLSWPVAVICWVVSTAWLIVAAIGTTTPQTMVSNVVLILAQITMIALHYHIHCNGNTHIYIYIYIYTHTYTYTPVSWLYIWLYIFHHYCFTSTPYTILFLSLSPFHPSLSFLPPFLPSLSLRHVAVHS